MLKPRLLYWTMNFIKPFRIYGLYRDRILSNNEMHKLLVRVFKECIFFKKNMSEYSAIFLCMLLMVFGIFIISSLTCRCLVCIFLPFRSWTTSLGFYLDPVLIWIDLILANYQLTVTSSSCMNSPIFFPSSLNLLNANFQMTVKSYSHSTVSETSYKYNSPLKISCRIIFFCL